MSTNPSDAVVHPAEDSPAEQRQFVRLVWRDNKIQAEDIDSSDIPQRYKDYEFLPILLEWVVTAAPGDSMPVMQERLLRYR